MDKKIQAKLEAQANIMKALAHPTRLYIVNELAKGELCVCEIMQALNISQSRASRNLGILKDAGFVNDRREGLWIYYSINNKKVTEYHQALNELISKWLGDEEIILADQKRLQKAVKYGQCKKKP